MVTVLIITLGGIAMVRYGNAVEKARSAEAYAALATIVSAENAYQINNSTNSYTANLSELDADIPASSNFTFMIGSAGSNAGFACAIRNGQAQKSYSMCLKNAKKGVSSDTSCTTPGCP